MFNRLKKWLKSFKAAGATKGPAVSLSSKSAPSYNTVHCCTHRPLTNEHLEAATFQRGSNPIVEVTTMDSTAEAECTDRLNSLNNGFALENTAFSQQVLAWAINQSFIGYNFCAAFSQNDLIARACHLPAQEAVAHGWTLSGLKDRDLAALKHLDISFSIAKACEKFVTANRVFGVRVARFIVDSTLPNYYQNPFNIDAVTKGSYLGIAQTDAIWCTPVLAGPSAFDASSIDFYEPTYWSVQGKQFHRSHCVIIRYMEVADSLKPTYFYGGLPLTQLLYQKVMAADASAAEGPKLLQSKRLNVLKMDKAQIAQDIESFNKFIQGVTTSRDNDGVLVLGQDDDSIQHDTSLSDYDSTVMTAYQLVASVAGIPATRLLGTTPKGFNSTGEHELSTYDALIVNIQNNQLLPLLQKHYALACRSLGIENYEDLEITFNPIDTPSAKEAAEIELIKAQTAQLQGNLNG